MNEALDLAYTFEYPIIINLKDWLSDTFTVNMRDGNIISFHKKDYNKFLKFCKSSLNGRKVTYIEASSNEITLQQNLISIN